MNTKQDLYILSTNQINKLHLIIWKPSISPIGIVQISHGMIEHIDRYDDFAKFLNKHGYIVIGNDHLGHGKTVTTSNELGYFNAEDPSATIVNDLNQVTLYAKKLYPHLPYFLLGHSMGSFIVRRYVMTYGAHIDGAIIMSTGGHSKLTIGIAHACVNLINKITSPKYHSKLLETLCFGTYNIRTSKRTSKDWLSRDTTIIDRYLKDPLCHFTFTVNGYKTLFDTLSFIQHPDNIKYIPKQLPIFMVAGDADPVGAYGKSVIKIYKTYKKLGINDIKLKLYKGARHELLNEINNKEVYSDILVWLKTHC